MRVLGELSPKGLPRPIPADELQVMIGPNQGFCSWDASILKVSEEMARWPFLFSGCQEPARDKAKPHPLKITKGAAPPLDD
jgi:hypothetical protein